jgi:hypothetical protein
MIANNPTEKSAALLRCYAILIRAGQKELERRRAELQPFLNDSEPGAPTPDPDGGTMITPSSGIEIAQIHYSMANIGPNNETTAR